MFAFFFFNKRNGLILGSYGAGKPLFPGLVGRFDSLAFALPLGVDQQEGKESRRLGCAGNFRAVNSKPITLCEFE